MSTPSVVTRSERAEQTRLRITDAAQAVFVARGYRASSLRDVAAAAGISHPGLLKHFATKDLLLAAVMERIEEHSTDELSTLIDAGDFGALPYVEVAIRNADREGYLALFAALVGEASTRAHPAHAWMRRRYATLRELSADQLDAAIDSGIVAAGRDPRGESTRLAAAWDGLQVLEQYLPERVEVIARLEAHQEALALPIGWRADDDTADAAAPASAVPELPRLEALFPLDEPDESGYRVGRARRARIVADATELFAREGYADTSLREIAERVGVSKSTLLHHYPSKDELLAAVLAHRDQSLTSNSAYVPAERAADALRSLPAGAAHNGRAQPGLIEVYAVLSCEAVPADHPAHEYFRRRYDESLDYFAELFRRAQLDGALPAHRDPEAEAIWLVALWDGLQYQWLYDRDAVDVAEHLAAHLADVLPA